MTLWQHLISIICLSVILTLISIVHLLRVDCESLQLCANVKVAPKARV